MKPSSKAFFNEAIAETTKFVLFLEDPLVMDCAIFVNTMTWIVNIVNVIIWFDVNRKPKISKHCGGYDDMEMFSSLYKSD